MANATATLWDVEIAVHPGVPDAGQMRVQGEAATLDHYVRQHLGSEPATFATRRGYLLEGELSADEVDRIAHELLADTVIESAQTRSIDELALTPTTLTVLRKPGVMDPVAQSAKQAIGHLGLQVDSVRTFQRYIFPPETAKELLDLLAAKVLANDAIEQVVFGPLAQEHLGSGSTYELVKITVPIRGMDDDALTRLSKEGQLYLSLVEMQTIRDHFERLGRNPTDVELETIAQTWSEHCSHKTLRGPYELNGQPGTGGLLKDTIMHVTKTLAHDWCVSVFEDNAGIIKFDDQWNVCFKVETHNHPSAIEPYGGANTGIGGVIRDPLGTGLGAKPICNTDVFCVASPETPYEQVPSGVLHPARVLRGVVAGVRDYGNRMGIPTVNGAVCFDDRYLGNPLVYCGTVGLIPAGKSFGSPEPGDLIVAIGGRTGRDGIHGATFSSAELTTESETVSGGAVQIGDPIAEKKMLDVLLRARDQDLYRAITDCGAGGFSSAVGEMGAKIGARVNLEKAPLKYQGLSYTEIWISEAQERMVLAVSPENWPAIQSLAQSEDVEAVVLGHFEPTGLLTLTYQDEVVGELSMDFLHDGGPAMLHRGVAQTVAPEPLVVPETADTEPGSVLRRILGSLNVCSKEWIIRQYDHEVQGGSVVKPLTGSEDDGPANAAVVAPILSSARGLAIGCGINPRYDLDPYRMAASAIDEALRNVVAVGGDPEHTALLDNFCWGNTERPEIFGSLCQAAFACRDIALGYGTPFISGKDSLNNEFDTGGERIVIPSTLLISAIAIVPDVSHCVTMDLKEAGNRLLLVGVTKSELGGSHFNLVTGATGGAVPQVDTALGKRLFASVHKAIARGLIRACHDLSEGGLAVAAAEMAFAGGLGAEIDLSGMTTDQKHEDHVLLFSESNTRFLLEVPNESYAQLREVLDDLPVADIGRVTAEPTLSIIGKGSQTLLTEPIAELKRIWKAPLAW